MQQLQDALPGIALPGNWFCQPVCSWAYQQLAWGHAHYDSVDSMHPPLPAIRFPGTTLQHIALTAPRYPAI